MKKMAFAVMCLLPLVVLLGGCATSDGWMGKSAEVKREPKLRIGVLPEYPPFVYKQGTRTVGIEADLGRKLGAALDRKVEFVEVPLDDMVAALLDDRIDIIMSGMAATKLRQVRVAFADAYMKNSLVAAIEREDMERFQTLDDILGSQVSVGVVRGSMADAFVSQSMPGVKKQNLTKIADARTYFDQNRIRLFIADICSVAWLVSENEAALMGVWIPLYEENVAWAVRREDSALRESINGILAGWKKDGTLKTVLMTHVPFLDRINWQVP